MPSGGMDPKMQMKEPVGQKPQMKPNRMPNDLSDRPLLPPLDKK
jgi:hypothetical protein